MADGFELSLQSLVSGSISGLLYGLLAVGLILAYRSSRALNFALGEMGTLGAAVFAVAATRWHWNYFLSLGLAILIGGVVGAGTSASVVHRLRKSPPLLTSIALLGLGQILLYLALATRGENTFGAGPPGLPAYQIGEVTLERGDIAALLFAPLLLGGLSLFLKRHSLGLAIRASAYHQDLARASGVSPRIMSSASWAIGASIATIVAILLSATTDAPPQIFGFWLLLRVLAASVIAGMSNLLLAVAAGITLGVTEQVVASNFGSSSATDVLLFAVIAGALVWRRGRLERDGSQRWEGLIGDFGTKSQPNRPLPHLFLTAIIVSVLAAAWFTPEGTLRLYLVVSFALVGLGVAVISGLGGVLTLGHVAVAGIGAAASIAITHATGNFIFGLIGAGLAAGLAATALGAITSGRGANAHAVLTLAFAIAAQSWLFERQLFSEGRIPGQPILGSLRFDTTDTYALFALAVFACGLFLVRNIWRTTLGLELVAQRDNELLARSFGISPRAVLLRSHFLSGVLAGWGGLVLAHGLPLVTAGTFPAASSVSTAALTAMGGLTSLWGPLLGSLYGRWLLQALPLGAALVATTAAGWMAVILVFPGGLAEGLSRVRKLARGRIRREDVANDQLEALVLPPRPILLPRPGQESPIGIPILELRGIAKKFAQEPVLSELNLTLEKGESVALVGPNGVGKTTLLDVISGFVRPDSGFVLYGGQDITHLSPQARGRGGMVRSFEAPTLFPTMKSIDVIQVALRGHQVNPAALLFRGPKMQSQSRESARELLELIGMSQFAHARIGQLSSGLRRLVEIVCVIALQPRLLLLDEPTSGLATPEVERLIELLRQLRHHLGLTMLFVEHDLNVVERLATSVAVMGSGKIIARLSSGTLPNSLAAKGGTHAGPAYSS